MSRAKAVDTNDYSMEEKIISLYELQKVDSKIDEINKLKGELPLEVKDLEDELEGLQTRLNNVKEEIDNLNLQTKQRKDEIEQSKTLIARYEEQQNNVRNNREFDSLSKEIEYQKLEIELSEKKLKEYSAEIKVKKKVLEDTEAVIADRTIDFDNKKGELESIDNETASEMEALKAQEVKAAGKIDERMLSAYQRIRKNVRNGLAVVTIKRDACGGCFNRIPPQKQSDIRTNKKIIICEYCGRVMISDLLDE